MTFTIERVYVAGAARVWVAYSGRLTLDHDIASRRSGQRIEQLGGQALARLPILEPEDPAGFAVTLYQPGRRPLDLYAPLIPTVEPEPGDISRPIVVTIHRSQGYPADQSVTTRAVDGSPSSGQL